MKLLVATILLLSARPGIASAAADALPAPPFELRVVPADRIYVHHGDWWDLLGRRPTFDLVVHAVAIVNTSPDTLTLTGLEARMARAGQAIQTQRFEWEDLEPLVRPIVMRNRLGLRGVLDLILRTDIILPPDVELAQGPAIAPSAAIVVPNLYLASPVLPDRVEIEATATTRSGATSRVTALLAAAEYAGRVEYALPVEGTWFMKGFPATGEFDHHRFGVSNEFGVDLLVLGPRGEVFANDGRQDRDFYSLGAPVRAAAPGRVVALNDSSSQQAARFFPRDGETQEAFSERQLHEVRAALTGDVAAWAAGNYVIIEHAGGEYSAYLHLAQRSARVTVGDMVERGQHIADVGNTGDSYGAHLHFQVMDGPDLLRARSLPFTFQGIVIDLAEPGCFVRGR